MSSKSTPVMRSQVTQEGFSFLEVAETVDELHAAVRALGPGSGGLIMATGIDGPCLIRVAHIMHALTIPEVAP